MYLLKILIILGDILSLKQQFEFLDNGIDVPFYNDIPKLSALDWFIVLAAILLNIGYLTVIPISNDYLPLAIFLTNVIPALYICKGNYSLFFKKLRLKDAKIIILCEIGIFVYTIAMGSILLFATGISPHSGLGEAVTIMSVLAVIFQVLGEEFFKVFILLIAMYAIYKLTGNRSTSLLIGLIGSMIIFGLAHYYAYNGRILQILLIQGLGSIFEYFAYLKTKNIWVSYLVHLIRDFIPLTLSALNLIPTTM